MSCKKNASPISSSLGRPATLHIRAMAIPWPARQTSLRARNGGQAPRHSHTNLDCLQAGNTSGESPSIDDHIEATRVKFAKLNNEINGLESEDSGMYYSHIASRLAHAPNKG